MRQSPVLISVFVIHFCLGAFFAWPAASKQILAAPDSGWTFAAGVIAALPLLIGVDFINSRSGIRLPIVLGGLFLGGGFLLGAFLGGTFLSRLFFYGILGGAGFGLAYVAPLSAALRWHPDRKGLAPGIAAAGFLLGVLFWDETAWGLLPLFGATQKGLQDVFLVFGILISAAVALASISAVPPPDSRFGSGKVEGISGPARSRASAGRILGRPYFYAAWLAFFFSLSAVFLVLDSLYAFGFDALSASGLEKRIASKIALVAAFWFWISAAAGGVVWGVFSDRFSQRLMLFAMFLIQTAVFFSFFFICSGAKGLILATCLVGFTFGGNFALFPVLAAEGYGDRNFSRNYSLLFTAALIAAIFGLLVSAPLKDALGIGGDPSRWIRLFTVSGVFSVASTVIALVLKHLE